MDAIEKVKEYFFNTAEKGNNISEQYYAQTVKFLLSLEQQDTTPGNNIVCDHSPSPLYDIHALAVAKWCLKCGKIIE